MAVSPQSPIKRLLHGLPRGTPIDMDELAKRGADAKLASFYARSGWLVRLGHGVYALPGDEITPLAATRLLQARVAGLHVGGKSALALRGVRHNLSARETLVLWADRRFAVPKWFTERYPSRAVFAPLFEDVDAALARATVSTPPGVLEGVRVSAPERAALEMLHEVGVHETLEEARDVFEGLRNLRTEVVGKLLSRCGSVKAVRLFLRWSRETGVVDVDGLRANFDLRVGSTARWVSRMADGRLLQLKPYG
jgi:hypothetical protein